MRRPWREIALVALVSTCAVALQVAVYGVRTDLSSLPPTWFFFTAIAWGAVAFAGVVVALVPSRTSMLPTSSGAAAFAVLAPLGVMAMATLMRVDAPGATIIPGPDAQLRLIEKCVLPALEMAATPFALATYLLARGAIPVRSHWLGAALGGGFGALGGFMLHIHCPYGGALHVGLGHAGPTAVGVLVGALLIPRLAR
jgi:hypothetical protein